jgi:hypothetical protein
MVELIGCIVALAVIITAVLWVNGIDSMKKNHPDYKAKDFFNEEENESNISR